MRWAVRRQDGRTGFPDEELCMVSNAMRTRSSSRGYVKKTEIAPCGERDEQPQKERIAIHTRYSSCGESTQVRFLCTGRHKQLSREPSERAGRKARRKRGVHHAPDRTP